MEIEKSIKVVPVSRINWNDFETLFQSKGILRNCWCMAWRMTSEELKQNNPESRKEFIKNRIDAKVPVGLLAYAGDKPVAWCSIAPRETYRRLGGDENLQKVWSIACFYIKPEYRDRGLIDVLIERAKTYARGNGPEYIEAYPVEPDSPSYRHMGFVHTFEKAGFGFVKKAGKRRHVMTCKL
ncbi:GNAT family N-acetyltransferase [Halalkalibaculum sp. DA384]|uniref:GNAT family N-acetyltransferase n=1 Tax=Halalkalibaculum sp. DA384 TaxID=3373606 RepID=UPI003754A97C